MKAVIHSKIASDEEARRLVARYNEIYINGLKLGVQQVMKAPSWSLRGKRMEVAQAIENNMVELTELIEWHPEKIIVDIKESVVNSEYMKKMKVTKKSFLIDYQNFFDGKAEWID